MSYPFKNLVTLVDQAVDQILPLPETTQDILHQAMRYTTLSGGKRLRGILVLAAGQAVGGQVAPLLPAAVALELIHTYSLIHDDLPCMDNDDIRRGKPANHVVYGEAVALLAGDALLTEAFAILADLAPQHFDTDKVVRAIGQLARAAGSVGMVGGQTDDLANTGHLTLAELDSVNDRKTGALIMAAVSIGAILSGATDQEFASLRRYGFNIGRAFQIVDDILDQTGDSQIMGKPSGSDKVAGKRTYPEILGIQQAKEVARNLVILAKAELVGLSGDTRTLYQIAEFILGRDR